MTETLELAVILIPCLVIAIVFHEVAHGWAALALGDPTAKEQRRLTLNPIRHVDPVGTLLVPGALALFGGPIFGWAKPVPVTYSRLHNPRLGMMAVAAAGPGTNFLLAALGAVIIGALGLVDQVTAQFMTVPGLEPSLLATALAYFVLINVFIGVFNLLPIPPFDGSHIVGGLLPESWSVQWQKLQALGMLMFVVLIAATWAFPQADWIGGIVLPPVLWVLDQFLSLAHAIAG